MTTCIIEIMKKINATKFKEQSLSIMDNLPEDGLIITKRGRPIAKITPLYSESSSLIGALRDKIKIKGNIFFTGVKWDAEP